MRPVDEVAVERATAGQGASLRLTREERAEAVRRLNGRGLSDGQVADRLRLTPRTILRIRHRHDIPAVRTARRLRGG